MYNVLITGATGFIGKNLVERFIEDENYNITALIKDNDENGKAFLNENKVGFITENDFSNYSKQIDFCIHLASYGVEYGARDIDLMIDVNVKFSERVLRFAAERNCKVFFNTGSCFEYGTGVSDRLINENDLLNPEDVYAASKVACENFLKVYSKILGVKMVTIRPFSIYGKYESSKRILPLILNSGMHDIPLDLTYGEQIRDYMDVSDVAEAIYSLVLNYEKIGDTSAINICSGVPISLKDFINKIIDTCKFNKECFRFGMKPYRQNESMYFAGDNSILCNIIGSRDYSITPEKIIKVYDFFKKSF